jgi:hypothetical protein
MPHSVAYTTTAEGITTSFGDIAIPAPTTPARLLIPADAGLVRSHDMPVAQLHGVVTASYSGRPGNEYVYAVWQETPNSIMICPQHLTPTIGATVTVPVAHDRLLLCDE